MYVAVNAAVRRPVTVSDVIDDAVRKPPRYWRIGRHVYHNTDVFAPTRPRSALWYAEMTSSERRRLTNSVLRSCKHQAYAWMIVINLTNAVRLIWFEDLSLHLLHVMAMSSLAMLIAILAGALWLNSACDRYANTDAGLIVELGGGAMPVEVIRQAVQDEELIETLPTNVPMAGSSRSIEDLLDEKEQHLVRLLLAWWEERISGLDDEQRHTALALMDEFEGSVDDLLAAARRL